MEKKNSTSQGDYSVVNSVMKWASSEYKPHPTTDLFPCGCSVAQEENTCSFSGKDHKKNQGAT